MIELPYLSLYRKRNGIKYNNEFSNFSIFFRINNKISNILGLYDKRELVWLYSWFEQGLKDNFKIDKHVPSFTTSGDIVIKCISI